MTGKKTKRENSTGDKSEQKFLRRYWPPGTERRRQEKIKYMYWTDILIVEHLDLIVEMVEKNEVRKYRLERIPGNELSDRIISGHLTQADGRKK